MNINYLKNKYELDDNIFNLIELELIQLETKCKTLIIRFNYDKLEEIILLFWNKMDDNFYKNNYLFVGEELVFDINSIIDFIIYKNLNVEYFVINGRNEKVNKLYKYNLISKN